MSPAPETIRSLVLGTAGHIDHGKTSLVFALTGTDTDRLPEEKSRGITIDLGFASMRLPAGPHVAVDVSFIDVPGHHAFIRNMLAGTGGVDAVLLVVAADEGVKPQTVEHLAICSLLGVRAGLVALTKADAVASERLDQVRAEVRRFLEHTFLNAAPILPVSARTGEGLPQLKDALVHLALQLPAPAEDSLLRLPVDRVFSVRGFGTVVTGTLQAGRIRPGDSLELQPGGRTVRVRGVQVHGEATDEACAPTRVALNLAGVDVADLHRGHTLLLPHTARPASIVDVELQVLPGSGPLRHRGRVRFHAWTSETIATVLLYENPQPGEPQLARLKLRDSVILLPGDKFVLRQLSPATTIGGGHVLDNAPLPRLRKAAAFGWLRKLERASPAERVHARVQRRGAQGIGFADLLAETGLSPAALQPLVDGLLQAGSVVAAGSSALTSAHLLSSEALSEAVQGARRQLERAGDAGLSRAELQSHSAFPSGAFHLVWDRLATDPALRLEQGRLHVATGPSASSADDPALHALEELYRKAGLASPIASEAATALRIQPQDLSRRLTVLLRKGALVRLGSDHLLVHAEALARLKADLKSYRGERFDVARFKSFTGLSRKHAIPLLEHLDGSRVTRNENGVRTIL